jgi:hypothetical protein
MTSLTAEEAEAALASALAEKKRDEQKEEYYQWLLVSDEALKDLSNKCDDFPRPLVGRRFWYPWRTEGMYHEFLEFVRKDDPRTPVLMPGGRVMLKHRHRNPGSSSPNGVIEHIIRRYLKKIAYTELDRHKADDLINKCIKNLEKKYGGASYHLHNQFNYDWWLRGEGVYARGMNRVAQREFDRLKELHGKLERIDKKLKVNASKDEAT